MAGSLCPFVRIPVDADRNALQDLLTGMRREYAHKLPGKLVHLEMLWREFSEGVNARGAELLYAAHAISGAAATFGFAEVGKAALGIEVALQPWCELGSVPLGADRRQIDEGIVLLVALSENAAEHAADSAAADTHRIERAKE